MPDLLFEIGCEEIPAAALAAALPELARICGEALAAAQLAAGKISTLGTPRRLALLVRGLLPRQPDIDERVEGPPVSAGEKARAGFARKWGLEPAALAQEGGRFVARRQVAGKDTRSLLPGILSLLLAKLPWPKSMRWGHHGESFVRPVQWMVALYDDEVVPVEFAGVRSGRQSRGHRFLAPRPFDVTTVDKWRAELKARFVIVDPVERRQLIEGELRRIEVETGLSVRADEALLSEVTNLVEYPVGIAGSFDERYLEVPEAVIVSAMRGHQRYFAMQTPAGKLANRFVTVAGTVVKDARVVAHGNERVLLARLADARFFFEEDRKVPLAERANKLDGIIWIKQLGTMRDKVQRMTRLARELAERLSVDVKKVERAAAIAKADLLTHMVGEFPDLQGTIGSAYARLGGEDPEIAAAIAEHYQPRGGRDSPAEGPVGAVLAVADRLDSLRGIFEAQLAPTGSADPYGARRAALGILQTVLFHNWREFTLDGLPDEILEFMRGRMRSLFADEYPADLTEAVLAADFKNPVDVRARLRALAALRARPDFEPLGIAVKRVGNILKGETVSGAVDPALLREPAERALFEAAGAIRRRVEPMLAAHDYDDALRTLTELKAPVDAFFDQVRVMAEDPRLRRNRLALLASIYDLFLRVADFRQLNLG